MNRATHLKGIHVDKSRAQRKRHLRTHYYPGGIKLTRYRKEKESKKRLWDNIGKILLIILYLGMMFLFFQLY